MSTTDCSKESGNCDKCRSACQFKPGWFKPGEAEKVAEFLGVSLQELFDKYLMVDWWEDYPSNTYVLSPAIVGEESGGMFPGNPKGTCVFFSANGGCQIHEVKPFECREYWCGENRTNPSARHSAVADSWDNKESYEQIVDLLGDEPRASTYDSGTFSDLLGGW